MYALDALLPPLSLFFLPLLRKKRLSGKDGRKVATMLNEKQLEIVLDGHGYLMLISSPAFFPGRLSSGF